MNKIILAITLGLLCFQVVSIDAMDPKKPDCAGQETQEQKEDAQISICRMKAPSSMPKQSDFEQRGSILYYGEKPVSSRAAPKYLLMKNGLNSLVPKKPQ